MGVRIDKLSIGRLMVAYSECALAIGGRCRSLRLTPDR